MRPFLVLLLVVGGCFCEPPVDPPITDRDVGPDSRFDPDTEGCSLPLQTCWSPECNLVGTIEWCSGGCPPGATPQPGERPPSRCDLGCGPPPPGLCVSGPCCDGEAEFLVDPTTCEGTCEPGSEPADLCEPEPACAAENACTRNGECTLTARTCCGVCGAPTLEDVIALPFSSLDDYRATVCEGDPACPGCASTPNPNLFATCNAATCVALDLGATSVAQCEVDDDCRLRVAGCCECGDTSAESLISIRAEALLDYLALVCDDETACAECEPIYPDAQEAFCNAGRCDRRSVE